MNGICRTCPAGKYFNFVSVSCEDAVVCGDNEVLQNGLCVCKSGYNKVNGNCILCQANSYYDSYTQECRCNLGYDLINGVCSTCPDNMYFSYSSNRCECTTGYHIINGTCGQCKEGWLYNAEAQCCYYKEPCSFGETLVNGKCECLSGWSRDAYGLCQRNIQCPENSQYNSYTQCCSCNAGYIVQGSQCIPQFNCGQNSYAKNGLCYCNDGFVLIRNLIQCRRCGFNEIYNGYDCVCNVGYARDASGNCARKYLAQVCGLNEEWDSFYKMCLCKANYNRVDGQCQVSVTCGANSFWNGVRCECETGFVSINDRCLYLTSPVPICPANSHFNGVACVCDTGFYEVSRFNCQRCPDGQIWDGSSCTYNTTCPSGYTWNVNYHRCDPKAINCGQNSEWNGAMCVCSTGYHQIDGNICIKCPSNTAWDGKTCNSQVPANSCGSNQILISGKCVCQDGFVNIEGACLKCPTGTTWNGKYCYSASAANWCMGQPNTVATNGSCPCAANYIKLDGCCVSN